MAAKKDKSAGFPDIPSMSFEAAIEELETIVRRLETGKETLETAIQDYTRGNALKEHCTKKLSEAKLQVDAMSVGADGSLSLKEI